MSKICSHCGANISSIELNCPECGTACVFIAQASDPNAFGKEFITDKNVKEITVPEGMISIKDHTFEGCKNLHTVNLPSTLKIIGDYAFANCKSLTEIVLPEGIRELGSHMFYGTPLKNIYIPDSVEIIQEDSLERHCTEQTVFSYGSTIVHCNENTFVEKFCLDHNILISTLKQSFYDDELAKNRKDKVFGCPFIPWNRKSFDTIGANIFSGMEEVKVVDFPDGIIKIRHDAFSNCSNLKSIRFTEGLRCIGDNAFSGTAVKTLVLPDTLKFIGARAFSDCKELHELYLPLGIKILEDGAFSNCPKLQSVYVPESIEKIGKDCFLSNSSPILICKKGSITYRYCKSNGISSSEKDEFDVNRFKEEKGKTINKLNENIQIEKDHAKGELNIKSKKDWLGCLVWIIILILAWRYFF